MLQLRSKGNYDELTQNRNIKLDYFWEQMLPKQVKIVGKPTNPLIIYKEQTLACYVKGDIIRFLSDVNDKTVRFEVNINDVPDIQKFLEWYPKAKHSVNFKIQIKQIPLFVCGMSKYNGMPVFGDLPLYYRTKEFAQEIINKFSLDYCEVV